MLRVRESSSLPGSPSRRERQRSPGDGLPTQSERVGARFRRPGEWKTSFSTGLRHPAAKVAVAAFVVVDLILVYRLTVDDSPAPLTTVPGGVGASSIQETATAELQKALGDLNEKISAVELFGIDPSPRESTHRRRPRQATTSGSGGSDSSSGSGSAAVTSGSGGSSTSSGSGGGSTSSGSGGSSTDSSGSSGGGGAGGGGGGLTGGGTGGGDATGGGGGGGG
jgi:hypothetical protein